MPDHDEYPTWIFKLQALSSKSVYHARDAFTVEAQRCLVQGEAAHATSHRPLYVSDYPCCVQQHQFALPRLLPATRFPVLIFCASPTISAMSLLYVSESCCNASLACRRYVKTADTCAVSCFKESKCELSDLRGIIERSSVYNHVNQQRCKCMKVRTHPG